jgi:hypothetical protein
MAQSRYSHFFSLLFLVLLAAFSCQKKNEPALPNNSLFPAAKEQSPMKKTGLLLANSLDSLKSIQASDVGPSGEVSGEILFLPAKFSNGVAGTAAGSRVSFPSTVIGDNSSGCIEFWVKPGKERDHAGKHYYYFDAFSEELRLGVQAGVEGNDVLFFVLFHQDESAIHIKSKFVIPDSSEEPFHVAVVWDAAGIGNSGHTTELYVDGRLDNWDSTPLKLPLGSGKIHLLNHRPGRDDLYCRDVVDQFRVWNYAKTEFADSYPLSLK